MPSSQSTNPRAPASTTPARCSKAICLGVSARAVRARCRARAKPPFGSPCGCRADSSSASANAEITLRMVPSTGCASAARALSAPRRTASARLAASSTGELRGLLGEANQELRHDRAGVAARTVDRVVADPDQQFADVAAAPAQRALQHAAQGRGEVAAGIAVGHREHVDAVEFVAGRDHPAGARDQRPAQRRGGHVRGVGDGHGHAHSLRSMGAQCLLRCSNATMRAGSASTL